MGFQFYGEPMTPAQKPIDDSTYSGRFAARLRELREKAGLTVEQVAEAMESNGYKMAARSFYHWEQAKRDPPLDAFPALAKALGQSVRNLMPKE